MDTTRIFHIEAEVKTSFTKHVVKHTAVLTDGEDYKELQGIVFTMLNDIYLMENRTSRNALEIQEYGSFLRHGVRNAIESQLSKNLSEDEEVTIYASTYSDYHQSTIKANIIVGHYQVLTTKTISIQQESSPMSKELLKIELQLSFVATPDEVTVVPLMCLAKPDLQSAPEVLEAVKLKLMTTISKSLMDKDSSLGANTRVLLITANENMQEIIDNCNKGASMSIITINPNIFSRRELFPSYMNRGMFANFNVTLLPYIDVCPSNMI